MVKRINVKAVLCILLVFLCLYPQKAASEPDTEARSRRADLGRRNPFSELPLGNKAPAGARTSAVTPLEDMPELYVQTVSLRSLDAQSLKEAIEPLCSQYGRISIDKKGNSLIICDTREYLQMILEEIDRIDRPSAGLCVETVTLKFLEAKNLKKAIDNMSSQFGSIATNDSTNSLIICDTRDRLDQIIAEIKRADQTPRQIMIEVVIMDIQLEDDTEIGVNWDRLFDPIQDVEYKQTLVDTLVGTATAGGDFIIDKASISGTIHALQEKRNVEILASPRVLVVSGQEASIRTIEEIPYTELTGTAEGGAQALTSTEFKEVGITLRVKATITDSDRILMTVQPEQSVKTGEATLSGNSVPVVDTRSVSTSLLVEDGQVVIMGGLRKREIRITNDKVPLLGDLPVVGFFFSRKKNEISNSELVVLLSPHIYKGEAVPEEVMKKWNTLKDRPMLTLPGKDDPANDPLSVLNLF